MKYRSLKENIERLKKMNAKKSFTDFFPLEQHDEIFISGLSVIDSHN